MMKMYYIKFYEMKMQKTEQANNNVNSPNANALRDILADYVERMVSN